MTTFIPGRSGGLIAPFGNLATGSGDPKSNRVQPGDLITAEFINNILDRLEALETQAGVPTATFVPPTTFLPPTKTFIPPTFFTPTLTFIPTLTLPTLFTPTLTFNVPTMLTPTFFDTIPPTFIATLFTPTVPVQTLAPTLPTSILTFPAGAGLFSPESEVTTLPGIGDSEKSLLNGAGITNLKGLSEATPQAVATALNTSEDHATTIVSMAKNVLTH